MRVGRNGGWGHPRRAAGRPDGARGWPSAHVRGMDHRRGYLRAMHALGPGRGLPSPRRLRKRSETRRHTIPTTLVAGERQRTRQPGVRGPHDPETVAANRGVTDHGGPPTEGGIGRTPRSVSGCHGASCRGALCRRWPKAMGQASWAGPIRTLFATRNRHLLPLRRGWSGPDGVRIWTGRPRLLLRPGANSRYLAC
jgi:hypothetical protein